MTGIEEDMMALPQRHEKAFGAGYEVEIGRDVPAPADIQTLTRPI